MYIATIRIHKSDSITQDFLTTAGRPILETAEMQVLCQWNQICGVHDHPTAGPQGSGPDCYYQGIAYAEVSPQHSGIVRRSSKKLYLL